MVISEWKLNTNDVDAFERQLDNFARHYVSDRREAGLESIDIGAWQAPGFFPTLYEINQLVDAFDGKIEPPQHLGARFTDETGQRIKPTEGRSWSLTFRRQSKEKEWLSVSTNEARFTISIAGGDYPMLFRIDSVMDTARPFVKAWIERCKELWAAMPLAEQSAQAGTGQQEITGGKEYPLIISANEAATELESYYRQWRGVGVTDTPDHNLKRLPTESDLILFVIEGYDVQGHDEIADTVIEFCPRSEGCVMYVNPNEGNLFDETLLIAGPFLEDFLRHIRAWLITESQPPQPGKSVGDGQQPMNIIADNRGGTVTKTTNTNGQTIIGGTVNAGYEYQSNGVHSAIVSSGIDIPPNMSEATSAMQLAGLHGADNPIWNSLNSTGKLDPGSVIIGLNTTGILKLSEPVTQAGNRQHVKHGPTKRVRSTSVKRIAYALYLMETQHLTKTSAAKRAHTNTKTMTERSNDREVIEQLERFKNSQAEVTKFQKEIAKYSYRS